MCVISVVGAFACRMDGYLLAWCGKDGDNIGLSISCGMDRLISNWFLLLILFSIPLTGLNAIKSWIETTRSINPITTITSILRRWVQENKLPILFSWLSETTTCDNEFELDSWILSISSFRIFICSSSNVSCTGWAFNSKSKSFKGSYSNSAQW